MLVKTKFRFSEIFFGMLLAVAIFAMGMLFASSPSLQKPSAEQHQDVEQQAPNKASEHHENAHSLWVPTDSVGLYTLVLAIVSAAQGYFLLRADRTARTTAEATKTLANKTAEMASFADRQADLAKRQHIAAYPPRLRVRHVIVPTSFGDMVGQPTFGFDDDEDVEAGLAVVNVGGSDAKIIRSSYRIYFSRTGLPIRSPLDTSDLTLIAPQKILTVGEAWVGFLTDKIVMKPVPEMGMKVLNRFHREDWKLYVMGAIRYQDEGGNDHFMGFCRERAKDGRFFAVDDPDYEYTDEQ
jgi:hypothetical protein